MKAPETVTVYHLATTTIPINVAPATSTSTAAVIVDVTVGTPTTELRRLDVGVAEQLLATLDTGAAVESPTTETEPEENVETATSSRAQPPAVAAPATAPAKTESKPAPPAKKSRKGAPTLAVPRSTESQAINEQLRVALASGATVALAAAKVGISPAAAQQRINKYNLRAKTSAPKPVVSLPAPALAPETVTEAVKVTAKLVSKAEAVEPAPNPVPRPPQAVLMVAKGHVNAMGARRRIGSLFAIGYDPNRIDWRLPGGFTSLGILEMPDDGQIPLEVFDALNALWRRLRYSPVNPTAEYADLNRDYPPPGKWDNIDDPDEKA
jgi:hypothetical protein